LINSNFVQIFARWINASPAVAKVPKYEFAHL